MSLTVDDLKQEAIEKLGFRTDDYFNIAEKFSPETLFFYIDMAFAVGYEQASRTMQTRNIKPVIFINELGKESKPYNSIREAAESININYDNLRKVIGKMKKCGGYLWKYA